MEVTLLHYYNEDTDDEYLVLKPEGDNEKYGEEGFKLINKCKLLSADITLPTSTVFTRC